MTERPILMSGPLVRAILDGRKTVTRRLPAFKLCDRWVEGEGWRHGGLDTCDQIARVQKSDRVWGWGRGGVLHATAVAPAEVGDTLLVRETARVLDLVAGIGRGMRIRYEADGTEAWVPWPERIKTPKIGTCLPNGAYLEACRLRLRVTDVRVERLRDITEEDAAAEGVLDAYDGAFDDADYCARAKAMGGTIGDIRPLFAQVWDSLAPEGSRWADNPWVWRVAFEREQP